MSLSQSQMLRIHFHLKSFIPLQQKLQMYKVVRVYCVDMPIYTSTQL